jgi:hypothetical protein
VSVKPGTPLCINCGNPAGRHSIRNGECIVQGQNIYARYRAPVPREILDGILLATGFALKHNLGDPSQRAQMEDAQRWALKQRKDA